MQNTTKILIPQATYHVYNRANGNDLLFKSEENYRYFLQQYQKYISPITDTFCYCLMPNHFHFLLRIRSLKELEGFFNAAEADHQGFKNLDGLSSNQKNLEGLSESLTKQFSNFFNAYAKAFNKQHHRKGSLFMHPFKRKRINDETYLRKLVHYIHLNPVEAGLSKTPEGWLHSSYPALIANKETFIQHGEVLNWFGNQDNFMYCHSEIPELSGIHPMELT